MTFKESETIELKKSTSKLKEGIKSIAAILNKHEEGELYFGVTDKGNIIGQDINNKTLRDISQTIAERIEPKIYPEVNSIELEDKKCILVKFRGSDKPYFAYGRAYIRVSDQDRPLSARALEGMIVKKNREALRWDNKVCKNSVFADISAHKLNTFLQKAGLEPDSVENSLAKLDLITDGKLRNTAILLFAENPKKFLFNAKLRCAVFGASEPIDMQEYEGDIFYLIDEAQKYILKNIHTGMRIEGLARIDVPEIAPEALREAIINAFCHRDYYNPDSVNIAIFSDKIEIRSPGLLYGGLTIDRIIKEKVSERRNELIADMLHRIHYIEKWGQGIKKILSKEPNATFKEVGRQFIAVFPRKAMGEKLGKKLGEKLGKKLGENEKKVFGIVSSNTSITHIEIATRLNLSPTAVWKIVAKLKKKNLLKRIGSARKGYWEVV